MKYFLSQFFHENVYFWLSFHTSKLSFSLKSVIVMTWDCHVKMDWTQHSANTQDNLSFIPSAQISVSEHQFWGKWICINVIFYINMVCVGSRCPTEIVHTLENVPLHLPAATHKVSSPIMIWSDLITDKWSENWWTTWAALSIRLRSLDPSNTIWMTYCTHSASNLNFFHIDGKLEDRFQCWCDCSGEEDGWMVCAKLRRVQPEHSYVLAWVTVCCWHGCHQIKHRHRQDTV